MGLFDEHEIQSQTLLCKSYLLQLLTVALWLMAYCLQAVVHVHEQIIMISCVHAHVHQMGSSDIYTVNTVSID